MTLTALNVVSIIVALLLICVLVVVLTHLRRVVADAEGAIDVIELDE